MDRDMQTLVWQYYRHRGCLNVNDVIKKYGRNSLVINYSITPVNNKEKVDMTSEVDMNDEVDMNCKVDMTNKVGMTNEEYINSEEYMNNLQKEIDMIINYNIDPYTLY